MRGLAAECGCICRGGNRAQPAQCLLDPRQQGYGRKNVRAALESGRNRIPFHGVRSQFPTAKSTASASGIPCSAIRTGSSNYRDRRSFREIDVPSLASQITVALSGLGSVSQPFAPPELGLLPISYPRLAGYIFPPLRSWLRTSLLRHLGGIPRPAGKEPGASGWPCFHPLSRDFDFLFTTATPG